MILDQLTVRTTNGTILVLVFQYCGRQSQWIAPAPIDAWWCLCTISYSFGTFAEMLGRLPNLSGFKITDHYLLWPVPDLS